MLRFREAIPDADFQIEDIIAEGDQVVVRLALTGTPVKEFPPIQAGEPMEFRAVAVFRLDGGLVTEEWFYRDAAG
jgi:predicted ester cyclase